MSVEAKAKVCFIVNPISGVGKQKKIKRLIKTHLDQKKFDYEIRYTDGPKRAILMSQEAANEGFSIIVAVGGDGSVNEVAQGIIGTNSALAIIPTGSGNGLARSLNIPTDSKKAIQVINKCELKWVDTVKINENTYLGVAGVGFDAHVSQAFAMAHKRGFTGYVKAIFQELMTYHPREYELFIDGKREVKQAFLICFANSTQYGNDVYIAPQAKIDDGYIDISILKEFPPHAAPLVIHDLFNKKIETSKYFETIRCQEVVVTYPSQIHVDGEPMRCKGDIFMRVLPSSLKILSP